MTATHEPPQEGFPDERLETKRRLLAEDKGKDAMKAVWAAESESAGANHPDPDPDPDPDRDRDRSVPRPR